MFSSSLKGNAKRRLHAGLHSLASFLCSKTTPKLKDKASMKTLDLPARSYKANIVGRVFSSLKACSCFGPNSYTLLVLSNSCSTFPISAIFGENFPIWLIIPMKLLRSATLYYVFSHHQNFIHTSRTTPSSTSSNLLVYFQNNFGALDMPKGNLYADSEIAVTSVCSCV